MTRRAPLTMVPIFLWLACHPAAKDGMSGDAVALQDAEGRRSARIPEGDVSSHSVFAERAQLGSPGHPIIVDELPLYFEGDTATAGSHVDGFECARICCDEGKELHFRVELSEPAIFSARVTPRSDGVELHLHLIAVSDRRGCLDGGFDTVERPLPAGVYSLIVDGPEGGEGAFVLEAHGEEPRPRKLGTMWNTYYILANEDTYIGPRTTMLYDSACRPITKVRLAFYNALCIQGSGVLSDGTVVNYDSSCTLRCPHARLCRIHPVRICYKVLDPQRYPWGMGKAPRPLVPDWSVAVDPRFVPLDSVIYIEELDGVVPPGSTEPHDGCVGAVDTGGGIEDNHIDIFAGTRERWVAWEKLVPTRSWLRAWLDHPRCYRHALEPDGDISTPHRSKVAR